MDLLGVVLLAVGVVLAILLFAAITLGWMPKNDGSGAAITGMHDLQPLDKQHATEIVIEQKAGKGWTEQESSDAGRGKGPERADGTAGDAQTGPRKGI